LRSAASLVTAFAVSYPDAVSRLRRPFLSDRYFFITVRLLKERAKLADADFGLLALAFKRARLFRHQRERAEGTLWCGD
jgi:hypothetical protein